MNRRQFMAGTSAAASMLFSSHAPVLVRKGEKPLREKLAADIQRPRFHFLPPANWMNDPNGPIYWNGNYHLFYQYNPNGAYWGDMHWGHARSPDLVHWKHLPVALAPTPGGPDEKGCFSGSAFANNGVPTLVYTGVSPEVQCLAMSDDAMIRWKKFNGNPIVASLPRGLVVTGFRDPSVWREGDTWLMTVGSGFKDMGGAVLLYHSKDAIHWEYLHVLYTGPPFVSNSSRISKTYNPVAAGDMWECPDFFALGEKHVLLFSTQGAVFYMIGSYRHRKFLAEASGKADLGKVYYAAKSFDDRGRRILWAWLREGRSAVAQREAGWSGVMSLPRVLLLSPGSKSLRMEIPSELQMLRGQHTHYANLDIGADATLSMRGCRGDSLEIQAVFEPGAAEEFGLKVRCSPDDEEETLIGYDRARSVLVLDARRSSLSPEVDCGVAEGQVKLGARELLELRIFLDASVIEIFANGHTALTGRICPSRADSHGLALYARRGRARMRSLDVYEMNAISSDRLTT